MNGISREEREAHKEKIIIKILRNRRGAVEINAKAQRV
jgi:hypothetical protein